MVDVWLKMIVDISVRSPVVQDGNHHVAFNTGSAVHRTPTSPSGSRNSPLPPLALQAPRNHRTSQLPQTRHAETGPKKRCRAPSGAPVPRDHPQGHSDTRDAKARSVCRGHRDVPGFRGVLEFALQKVVQLLERLTSGRPRCARDPGGWPFQGTPLLVSGHWRGASCVTKGERSGADSSYGS